MRELWYWQSTASFWLHLLIVEPHVSLLSLALAHSNIVAVKHSPMFVSLPFPFSTPWHLCLSNSHFVLILPLCFSPSPFLPLPHTFQCLPGDAYHWRAQHLFLHPIDPVIETSLICRHLPVLAPSSQPAPCSASSFALSRESHLNSLTITHNPSLQLRCNFKPN